MTDGNALGWTPIAILSFETSIPHLRGRRRPTRFGKRVAAAVARMATVSMVHQYLQTV